MIIFAFGGALPYKKDLPVVKQIKCDAAKNPAREYCGDKKLRKKGREAYKTC